jgi:hypothetical protein
VSAAALCLRYTDHGPNVPRPAQLPIETPRPGQLGSDVKQPLADGSLPPRLVAALERDRAGDPRAELEEIVREFYVLLERNRRAIKLIDRCMGPPGDRRDLACGWAGRNSRGPGALHRTARDRRAVSGSHAASVSPRARSSR